MGDEEVYRGVWPGLPEAIAAPEPARQQQALITTNLTDSATFTIDGADVPALRNAVLRIARSGYCEAGVCARLGLSDLTDLLWRAIPIYREEHLAVRDALASAIDLFLLQGAIPLGELDRLFDKAEQDLLVRAGLLFIDEQGLSRARVALSGRGLSGFLGPCLAYASKSGMR